ncbi:Methyltransferase domain-containing protein [Flavobacterium swingsii]|uniref:Methyltransferase domain-containing protein n=1 Tax=Flavobacterium swingsii TaxID=498292 RepID=A0A1I0WC06_9FLAO|nr:class I SAM-dependent methyltransferase [Flavobacterium swingsii]SFA85907.1 Methyltransferase domain-containing protein [Flavobacterium swingsii]
MKIPENYIETNKQTWNNKTDIHIASDFYNNEAFLSGKSSLMDIELNLLGDISGKKILHLQCHFGQDTLSLARLGAKVTGVDLSDNAINKGKELNQKIGLDAEFICCNVYDLENHLDEKFDIVFTSYGTIGWLPDLDKWAKVVSNFLKPGGQFIFAEFHPVVWMYDDNFKNVFYSYFNIKPIIEYEEGTYANRDADVKTSSVCWNHSTSEVLNSLIKSGLEINSFDEYDYSPYNCFNETEEFEKGKFRIKHLENKIPMVFSLVATKK